MLKINWKQGPVGFLPAVIGMRNPLNSWNKSDSSIKNRYEELGPNDILLAEKLASKGSTHAKYRRMITVWVDITAPLYWWKEFDTYKVGTVANSCSTMHKIHEKEFTLDDFSCEHLFTVESGEDDDRIDENTIWLDDIFEIEDYRMDEIAMMSGVTPVATSTELLKGLVAYLNTCRENYLETKDKKYWWQMIQLLPSSYNQKRTVCLNYEVLSHIYADRRNHKLDEWHTFCDWIEELPHAKEMIFPEKEEKTMDDHKKLQLAIGKAVNSRVANILYRKFALSASEIAKSMDIPESVVRSLIKEAKDEDTN